MNLGQFDHGYWCATELEKFARQLGIPGAMQLRKDELEKTQNRFGYVNAKGERRHWQQ